tara:strand:- start:1075 stop:1764 length:690 start_codon:yes stop_codon:yes gene_type:complete
MRDKILFFVAGFFVGVAELLPGISGATVALMFGVYKKIISFINNFKGIPLISLFLVGMIIGIFGFSQLVEFFFLNFRQWFDFIIGIVMIFYGTYLVLTNISDKSIKNYLFNSFIFLIAVFVGSSLSQISEIEVQKTFLLLLVYGFIACSFLIIPGISGSAFLLAIGIYPEIIAAISNLNLDILFPFGIGMLTALFFMPKLIHALFKKYEPKILVTFGGFIFGAGFIFFS